MPIYEYICQKCSRHFEALVLPTDESDPICPHCKADAVTKLISAASFRPQGIPTGKGGFKTSGGPPVCSPSGR